MRCVADDETPPETPEEKRARVMRRLAEIIRSDPPDLSGGGAGSGPVTAGGFPIMPADAEGFDQEAATELFAALSQFFEQHRDERQTEAGAEGSERE